MNIKDNMKDLIVLRDKTEDPKVKTTIRYAIKKIEYLENFLLEIRHVANKGLK